MASITNLRFEHYDNAFTTGVEETKPRLSWKIASSSVPFKQICYEIEISEETSGSSTILIYLGKVESSSCTLVPWPAEGPLHSRQAICARVRACDDRGSWTLWSNMSRLETGLLARADWQCSRISAPWDLDTTKPQPENLFRKEFLVEGSVTKARLYVTAQGVYEAELNGQRIGDYFMAPGWTSYDGRLQYQTYDVTPMLSPSENCLGVRVAEGWFSGRLGWEGGRRNIWGDRNAILAQLEITYQDTHTQTICSDSSWLVAEGPIRKSEIYDGETYDATFEIPGWSSPLVKNSDQVSCWRSVTILPPLSDTTNLTPGFGGPVRRTEIVKPVKKSRSPSGKIIVDFGQNLVGYIRLRRIKGRRGLKITLYHAEVLEHGELGRRPLRVCEAKDEYILKGLQSIDGETYEPRFTFHGFRYAQIDGWLGDLDLDCVEAVVCNTELQNPGSFSCSHQLLNKLYSNITWGMRGNFLSVPTDCPQRDERLGWTGDLAVFAPTAVLLCDCFGMLKNWLVDLEHDQKKLGGCPPMVCPNPFEGHPEHGEAKPFAIWQDAAIIVPWVLYQDLGDANILTQQWSSMVAWIESIPRNETKALWDSSEFQLGDWLDPAAPADAPYKSPTDAVMVANMFLVHVLDILTQVSRVLGKEAEQFRYAAQAQAARSEFQDEYVTSNGRIVSDTQAAYAIAICLDTLTLSQRVRAGKRLAEIVRRNSFKVATGFAGTPFICEALAATGHTQVAYALLVETGCPSWLYPVTMDATTVWERWDSMLPNGDVNPGEMTSFNHYAFGAIAKFMYERLAGLQRLEAGWTKCRVAPLIGADFSQASASHVTPNGRISCTWETHAISGKWETFKMEIEIPHGTTAEVVIPEDNGLRTETIGSGAWLFESKFVRDYEWPVPPLGPKE